MGMAENNGFGLVGALGMLPMQMAAGNALRVASVQRAGVVEIGVYDGTIRVNQENLVDLISEEVEKRKPTKDSNGKFAARVYIQVELLGDQEPAVFEEWKNTAKEAVEKPETSE